MIMLKASLGKCNYIQLICENKTNQYYDVLFVAKNLHHSNSQWKCIYFIRVIQMRPHWEWNFWFISFVSCCDSHKLIQLENFSYATTSQVRILANSDSRHARSCPFSICPGHPSIVWLVSLVVFSCRMVSKW